MEPLDVENATVSFLDSCQPSQWLAMMRWAAPELVKTNQRLLAELICREAQRRQKTWPNASTRQVSDDIAGVLGDLNLRLDLRQ